MKFKSFLWSLLTMLALSVAFTACSDDDDTVTPTPGPDPTPGTLTFQLNVSNISAHAADLEIIPSEDKATYFADLIPASAIAGMDDQAKIDFIMARMDPEDLVSGRQFVNASEIEQDLPLEAATDYVLFALGYENGKVTSQLATKSFTTLKDGDQPEPEAKGPDFSLTGSYLPTSGEIAFDAKCTSADATAAVFVVAEQAMMDQYIAESSIEGVLAEGQAFIPDWIELFNSETGIRLAVGPEQGVEKGQTWSMILKAENAKGGKTIKRADCVAEGEAPEPGAIEVRTEGYAGDEQGQNGDKYICVYMQCSTRNATEAFYGFGTTPVIAKLIKEQGSIEAFMDAYQQSLVDMVPSAINELNSETPMLLKFGPEAGIQANTSYTWVIRVKNAEGDEALASVEIKTDRASTVGAPDVEFVGKEKEGKLVFGARCTSLDAVYGGLIVFGKPDYDQMIADGMTMQSIMEAFPENVNVFSDQWLGFLNSTDGIALTVADAQPGLVLSGLLEVRNETGKTYRYADTEGGQDGEQIGGGNTPDPEQPVEGLDLKISGTYDRNEDALFIDMLCASKDAIEAYVVVLGTKDLDAMMAANKMTEQDVVGLAIQQSSAVAFDADMLSMLNGDGLGLTMTEAQNLVRDEKYSFLLMGTNADMASRTVRLDIVYGEEGINSKELLELTQAEFKQYIWDYTKDVTYKFAGDKPTVLEFGATWCGGCQQTLPVLEKLAKEYDGRVNFFQSDVDNDPQSYQLMGGLVEGSGIPLVMFLDVNGGIKAVRGALPSASKIEAEFRKLVEGILAVQPEDKPVDPNVEFGFTLSAKCFVDGGKLKAQITMQSPSKDVDKAFYMWAQKTVFDKNMGYVDSIEQMFDEFWVDPLPAEAVAAMNADGYVFEAVEDGAFFVPDLMFTYALDARNAAGERMVKRVDFMAAKDTEVVDPDLPSGPQVDGELVVDGWAGDREKVRPFDHCTFNFKYPGAQSGRYFLSDAASLDAFEEEGFDIIEAKGYDFEAARMERMRSEEGLYIDLEFLPEATAAIAYRITNSKGEVKEGRYDVKLASLVEGNGPSIYIELATGDEKNLNHDTAINAGMVCRTGDAVAGRFNLYDTKSLDGILAGTPDYPMWKLAMSGGQRIEDVPDYEIWNLQWFNQGGMGYVQTGLKPATSYSMLLIAYDINGVYTVERADCTTAEGSKAMAQALRNSYTHAYAANTVAEDLREIRTAEPEKQLAKGQLVPTKFERKPARKQALVAEGRTMTERPMMITGKLFGAAAPKMVARDVKVFEVASVSEMNTMRTAEGVMGHNAQVQMISKAQQTRYEVAVMGQKSAKRLVLGKFLK